MQKQERSLRRKKKSLQDLVIKVPLTQEEIENLDMITTIENLNMEEFKRILKEKNLDFFQLTGDQHLAMIHEIYYNLIKTNKITQEMLSKLTPIDLKNFQLDVILKELGSL
ncbi:MAG: hypothetical protein KA886_04275 [Candidatus Cloacimonetes bacterium]|nr:hypothetical protein [Candidatus Cloacimonadota bacterium]